MGDKMMMRMISQISVGLLFFIYSFGCAAEPFVSSNVVASEDTDHNRVRGVMLGVGVRTSPDDDYDKFGIRHGMYQFSAPGFSLHGNADVFFGARTLELDSGRKIKAEAELGQIRLSDEKSHAIGAAQISADLQGVNYELRFERNIVDSENSLRNGVTYNATTVALDYPVSERLNVAGVLGWIDFSDNNNRPLGRMKLSYVVSEEQGLAAYVRGRLYRDSNAYSGNYFSPEHYAEYLLGASVRRRIPALRGVLSAYAEYGQERVDGSNSSVYAWQIRYQSVIQQPLRMDVSVGRQTTAGTGGGPGYRYQYARADFIIPF
jgi:hypothetical protein